MSAPYRRSHWNSGSIFGELSHLIRIEGFWKKGWYEVPLAHRAEIVGALRDLTEYLCYRVIKDRTTECVGKSGSRLIRLGRISWNISADLVTLTLTKLGGDEDPDPRNPGGNGRRRVAVSKSADKNDNLVICFVYTTTMVALPPDQLRRACSPPRVQTLRRWADLLLRYETGFTVVMLVGMDHREPDTLFSIQHAAACGIACFELALASPQYKFMNSELLPTRLGCDRNAERSTSPIRVLSRGQLPFGHYVAGLHDGIYLEDCTSLTECTALRGKAFAMYMAYGSRIYAGNVYMDARPDASEGLSDRVLQSGVRLDAFHIDDASMYVDRDQSWRSLALACAVDRPAAGVGAIGVVAGVTIGAAISATEKPEDNEGSCVSGDHRRTMRDLLIRTCLSPDNSAHFGIDMTTVISAGEERLHTNRHHDADAASSDQTGSVNWHGSLRLDIGRPRHARTQLCKELWTADASKDLQSYYIECAGRRGIGIEAKWNGRGHGLEGQPLAALDDQADESVYGETLWPSYASTARFRAPSHTVQFGLDPTFVSPAATKGIYAAISAIT